VKPVIEFLTDLYGNEKMYLFSGLGLLVLAISTSSGKISSRVQQFSYLGILIWLICIGYRVITGEDLIR
jgi:hypothetical protein